MYPCVHIQRAVTKCRYPFLLLPLMLGRNSKTLINNIQVPNNARKRRIWMRTVIHLTLINLDASKTRDVGAVTSVALGYPKLLLGHPYDFGLVHPPEAVVSHRGIRVLSSSTLPTVVSVIARCPMYTCAAVVFG
jgi:hypothetical protein